MSRTLLMVAALGVLCAPAAHARRPRIEVAFALDATGSMGSWIEEARQRIKDISDDLAEGTPRPDVRFALVSYRDRGDAYVTRVHPFTREIAEMRANLDGTHASGGGDTPEAVIEALAASVDELGWTDDQDVLKLVYLVGDAGPKHYPDGPDLEAVLERALHKGIVIHSIACGQMAGGAQGFLERVARLSEGRPFRLADSVRRRQPGGTTTPTVSAAGAAGASSLASAVSGSARAYSGAVGVDFAAKRTPIPVRAVAGVPTDADVHTGLLGRQLRLVTDAATWTDVWAAHVSVRPEEERSAPPAVDFGAEQVLVLGGAESGLALDALESGGEIRLARLTAALPGVRFVLVPVDDTPVVAAAGGAL